MSTLMCLEEIRNALLFCPRWNVQARVRSLGVSLRGRTRDPLARRSRSVNRVQAIDRKAPDWRDDLLCGPENALATTLIIPAKAGIQFLPSRLKSWIPAFAAMTNWWRVDLHAQNR